MREGIAFLRSLRLRKQVCFPQSILFFSTMMVSLTAALSEFGPEMQVTSGLSSGDTKVVEAYWRLVDETVFGQGPKTDRARARTR